jgi:two-component system, NarL family, response regulator DevR
MQVLEGVVRVMVVEESVALSSRLVERLAETAGVNVVGTARTVMDAVRRIAVLNPDMVIIDVDMAEGGGFALLQAIHMLRELEDSAPAVVLWTGCQDPRRQARARELGAQMHFDKTRELDQLVEYCRMTAAARCRDMVP